MELIKTINTSNNTLLIYKEGEEKFVFKPSKNIEKEITANKLADIFGIRTILIEKIQINNVSGIKMNYMQESTILANYKNKLNKNQIQELKKIILFDIWIGNKDRHTANIFNKGKGRQFIKIDIGRKLNENFVDIIEILIDKKTSVKEVLLNLGFDEEDFPIIKEEDIKNCVNDKERYKFLCSRIDFSKIEF